MDKYNAQALGRKAGDSVDLRMTVVLAERPDGTLYGKLDSGTEFDIPDAARLYTPGQVECFHGGTTLARIFGEDEF